MSHPEHPERDGRTKTQADAFATTAMRRTPQVEWKDSAGEHSIKLDRRTVIGSAADVNLVIQDPAVSRLHAEFDLRDGGLWLTDLGSRNGTLLEGLLIASARVPEEGGTVRVGSTVLKVTYARRPTAVELWATDRFGPLIGRSNAMRELFARLARIAASDATVLIQGETGTGKELVARALHNASPRASKPYVIVDCGALPDTLLEAELFGHARGAFTGAQVARAGAIEDADGGTVFLDEIGELPLNVQPKLLRAIESRTVRRLGETAHRNIDVRFLAATHRDLRQMVNSGAFREDLYFRVAVVPVLVPPLRTRPEDIVALIEHFLPTGSPPELATEMAKDLGSQPWLGNVRELRNFVDRARALGSGEALAMFEQSQSPSRTTEVMPAVRHDQPYKVVRDRWLDHLEKEYLKGLLEEHKGNISAAAEIAGLDRSWVHRLVKKHHL